MRLPLRPVAAALLLLQVGLARADAQEARVHEGIWGSLGAGGGWNLSDNLEGERLAGFTVFGRAGYTLSQKWLLGGEIIGWIRNENDETLTRGNLSATVLFYPSSRGGFFFKGGVGLARVEFRADVASAGSDTGLGTTLGLGYDIRLGSNLYLTATADWLFQDVSLLDETNQLATLTLGLTWH